MVVLLLTTTVEWTSLDPPPPPPPPNPGPETLKLCQNPMVVKGRVSRNHNNTFSLHQKLNKALKKLFMFLNETCRTSLVKSGSPRLLISQRDIIKPCIPIPAQVSVWNPASASMKLMKAFAFHEVSHCCCRKLLKSLVPVPVITCSLTTTWRNDISLPAHKGA